MGCSWWVSISVDTFWSAWALTPIDAPFNRRRFSGLGLEDPVAGILALGNAKGSGYFPMESDLSEAVPASWPIWRVRVRRRDFVPD